MNYYDLNKYKKDVYPAIILDEVLPYRFRKLVRKITAIALLLLFPVFIFGTSLIASNIYLFRAVFIILLCGHVGLQLLEAMYRSFYFKKNTVDIRVLKILNTFNNAPSTLALDTRVNKKDLTKTFLEHEMGRYVMYRLGFFDADIKQFLDTKTDIVTIEEFEIIENDDDTVSFAEFGFSLIHFDSDLTQLLRKNGITVADFKQTLEWVSRMDKKAQDQTRWWLKDRLLRIPSIGKNIAFGQVYYLERFGHSIYNDISYIQLGEKWRTYKTSVGKLESALSKAIGGNILLTAKETYLCMDAIASLGRQVLKGTTLPSIENKRIYILDANALSSTYDSKNEFEIMFQQILIQTANAGNVILVIPNLPEFVQNSHALGSDVKDLLSEVLRSSNLHVIITANDQSFHEVLETDFDLMSHFEKVQLEEFDEFQAISILQDEVLYAESREGVFFTYQAIKRIVESADRYFSDTSLSGKSIDILYEIIPVIKQQGKLTVTQQDIDNLITSKTGITLGKITKDESQKLSQLNKQMHQRVVGQDAAVDAVCDAMLRARAGLANPKRPFASFMFVGPTGVGKTETAKALAALFFGDEENMLRSDMSEYSDHTALSRMIGEEGRPGVFASKVREASHGVLLLDEFEKAASDVHDLFLQIIDEGYFTDGRGEKVNMRNFIIIATSNAGSDLLYAQDETNPTTKEDIVSHIIAQHLFRTELLNRFDDVILFNSLKGQELNSIAILMVQKLAKRLDQRGITLKETPELISYLAKVGNNPKFGAREMSRVILKELESRIAQALVLGDLFEGDTISFTVSNDKLEIQKYS